MEACSKPPSRSEVSDDPLREICMSGWPDRVASIWISEVLPPAIPPTSRAGRLCCTQCARASNHGSWLGSSMRSCAAANSAIVHPKSAWAWLVNQNEHTKQSVGAIGRRKSTRWNSFEYTWIKKYVISCLRRKRDKRWNLQPYHPKRSAHTTRETGNHQGNNQQ